MFAYDELGKSDRPRALKNAYKLPVIFKINSKAWVTQPIFLEWFNKNFVPEIKEHFKKIGLTDDMVVYMLEQRWEIL